MWKKLLLLCIVFIHTLLYTGFSANVEISTIERPPFVIIEDGDISWFSIELWEAVAARLSWKETYEIERTFVDMLDKVATKQVDMAIANISVTSQREEIMDFTYPIFDSWLHIIERKRTPIGILVNSRYLQVFLMCILILLALLYHSKVWPETLWKRVGRVGFVTCIFLFLWLWTVEVKLLMDQQTWTIVNVVSYLSKKQVGAAVWTTMSDFLDQKSISYKSYDDFSDSLNALKLWHVEVILSDAAIAQYLVNQQDNEHLLVVGELFAPDKLAFALNEDFPFTEKINETLLELKEDGTYDQLVDKYFKDGPIDGSKGDR